MASPVTPADALAVIPDSTSSKCAAFVKSLLQLPVLFWQLISYMFDADGNLTAAFLRASQPAGTLVFSAAELDDDNLLLCNGSNVSRTTYATLFAAIATTYGVGDGSTTFGLPDFRDHFPIGQSATKIGGTTGGDDEITLVLDEMPKHKHWVVNDTDQGGVGGDNSVTSTTTIVRSSTDPGGDREYSLCSDIGNPSKTANVGLSSLTGGDSGDDEGECQPHSNIPPYVAVWVYIRV